ncbi:MAG: hypothetical protein GF384_04900 [Elusimicrobia bacterium]|nr:hypothetical protein [Elusimicrobiota bacterium]
MKKIMCICGGMFVLSLTNTLLGAQSVKKLIRDLENEDPATRTAAVQQLGQSNDQKAVDPLIDKLQDPNPNVRGAVVDALGELRAKKAKNKIAAILTSDSEGEVRQLAAIALRTIGDDSIQKPLITALNDTHIGTQLEAIKTAGSLRLQGTSDALIPKLTDDNPTVREYAVEALGKINDKKAIKSIEKLLDDPVIQVR